MKEEEEEEEEKRNRERNIASRKGVGLDDDGKGVLHSVSSYMQL